MNPVRNRGHANAKTVRTFSFHMSDVRENTNTDGPRSISNGVNLREELAPLIKGDVSDDLKLRTEFSRDTSIFERMPSVVVFPKDAQDVAAVVKYVHDDVSDSKLEF